MNIKESFRDNIAVLSISGKMMGGPETSKLHDKIKSLVSDGINKVIIDLSKVKWMNSSGLGALMASWGTISRANGTMALIGATEKVNSLLMVTKIISFFDTFDTVDRAIGSLTVAT